MNHCRKIRTTKGRESGVALIVALLALLLISAVTAGMIILSNTETDISTNFRDEQKAFFSAKAGIEEARDRLRSGATDTIRTSSLLPTTLAGSGNTGVLYILNPLNGETVAPWSSTNPYVDTEICKENTSISCSGGLPSGSGWYRTTAASTTYAVSPVFSWKWARVTLKQNNSSAPYYTNGNSAATSQVFWDGTNECLAASPTCAPSQLPVYNLTALAVTRSGSRRMVQAEVAEDQLNFTAPSALTLDGTGDAYSGGNSSQFNVDGNDHPGCGISTTGAGLPAVGVTNAADVAAVTSGIPSNRTHNYTGVDGTTPDVKNVSSTLPPNMQSVSSLQNLLSTIKNSVTQPVINGPASNPSNVGTASAPQIIYVNGDLSLSGNTTGYGILVVTGTLTAVGTSGWNGIVLVVGTGNAQFSGNTSWNGAVLVANTTTGLAGNLTVLGPTNSGINGGGNGGINYSSGCIAQASTISTFHVIAIRELMN
ncbi:MAG: PilX N-terminal domain-containing pilus assembly protein [Candidatus Acidiferrum sp.]